MCHMASISSLVGTPCGCFYKHRYEEVKSTLVSGLVRQEMRGRYTSVSFICKKKIFPSYDVLVLKKQFRIKRKSLYVFSNLHIRQHFTEVYTTAKHVMW